MGLRRHQVENLIRRGPNFYWRARIPVGFEAAGKNTRLSLSLRLSDRKIASVVARRLNALLVEIELLPGARMATREQLAKIFALEIESMRDEIEKLDRAAKRGGTLRDTAHREADRQVGYAYRLLEAYGPAESLDFEPGSEVHAALLEVGVKEADVPFIAETFRSEREGVLSDRSGRTKSPFLQDVLHRMVQVGLDDTVLNRDAAAEEIFRARADAFLASADDPRKPKLSGASQRSAFPAVSTLHAKSPQKPQPMWTADVSVVPSPDGYETAPAPTPISDLAAPSIPSAVAPLEGAAPASDKTAVGGDALGRKNLPLSRFDEEVDKMIANKGTEWDTGTASDARVLVTIFRGILEEHGVKHSGEITQAHVAALRQHFNLIIPSWGRSQRLRALSTKALRDECARLVEEASAKGETKKLGLARATICRHLGNLTHFQTHLQASHYAIVDFTLKGLRPKKPSKGDVRHQQVKPGPDQVRPIFNMPIFTGRVSADKPDQSGDLIFHSANYFLPMLFAYLGPRRNEFAGLMVNEIVLEGDHWAIEIKGNKYRRKLEVVGMPAHVAANREDLIAPANIEWCRPSCGDLLYRRWSRVMTPAEQSQAPRTLFVIFSTLTFLRHLQMSIGPFFA